MSKASVLKAIKPAGENSNPNGEYQQVSANPKDVPSTIPAKSNHKDAMIDGPFGGKKPA